MSQINNPLKNMRVEFHILQSFPVTCLNRDDVGAPKSAIIGGVPRARVSSQCWKRQIRLAMQDLGVTIGIRTKLIHQLLVEECQKLGATEEQADNFANEVTSLFLKKAAKKKTDDEKTEEGAKSDALMFISRSEVAKLAKAFKENNYCIEFEQNSADKEGKSKTKKVNIESVVKELIGKPDYSKDGLDIALFGRMVAQAPTLNIEGACSFNHAISTHKVTNEIEFFTALDDFSGAQGSAHMGSLEFNSATYYRYVSIHLGQLWENLAGQNINEALNAFIKALYLAVPSARQATQSGASPWEYARIYVRKGQGLQAPFETPIRQNKGGYLEPSKTEMCSYLEKKEKLAGSLFGKMAQFDFGDDIEFNIDKLAESVCSAIVRD